MPSQRITMRKIREVLRLRFECKLSLDAIARALSLSKGVVAKYVKMVEQRHESWEALASLDDSALSLALCSLAPPVWARHGLPAPLATKLAGPASPYFTFAYRGYLKSCVLLTAMEASHVGCRLLPRPIS